MAVTAAAIPEFRYGDRFRKARVVVGMTLKEMGKTLTDKGRKTSGSSVSAWERGETQPNKLVDLVRLYSEITGLPESWFWTGNTDSWGLSDHLLLAGQMTLPLALNRAA